MERTKKPVLPDAILNLKEHYANFGYNTDVPKLSRFQMGNAKTYIRKDNTETLCYVSW